MEHDQELTELQPDAAPPEDGEEREAPGLTDEAPMAGEEGEAPQEDTPAQKLADHIKARTMESRVTPLKKLKLAPPAGVTGEEAAALLLAVGTGEADPALESISFVEGKKDLYFFDTGMMTRHFAELQSMLEDKDILHTIATVTRSDCQLYPRPTQFSKLTAYPFHFSEDEIWGAAARMKLEEQYADIDIVTATNGGRGFYSSKFMSRRYAQALIQQVEVEEQENP